jgi:7-cyano-7-deazaguanine synthase
MIPHRVLLLLSGGLDSSVLLHELIRQQCVVHCLGINYGQRHIRELACAHVLCRKLNVEYEEIKIPQLPGSSLTDGQASVVVPNRNAILISIAVNLAIEKNTESVIVGCNKSDSERFPDCRPEFIASMNAAIKAAELRVEVCAPFIDKTKKEIADLGKSLGVDLKATWSCYNPRNNEPCGVCPACYQRIDALCG